MQNNKELFIPPKLLILDGVGMVLLGLGLVKYFADVDVIPANLRFDNYDVAFIIAGIAMALPAILHVVNKTIKRNRNQQG
jgi:hypothetical protein